MDKIIKRLKIHNFKRFDSLDIEFNDSLNLFIGDNEAGKSTILTAIDIVISGSRNKVERYGLESLFNKDTIDQFLSSQKKYEDLPSLFVELYLNDQKNEELEGRYNSENQNCHGLQLLCEPRKDLSSEIAEILKQDVENFPFEYYSTVFKTFKGKGYSGYNRYLQHLFLDSTQIRNKYAKRQYIKKVYSSNTDGTEKNKYENEYRKYKEKFKSEELADLNSRIDGSYNFSVKTGHKSNLENDLTIKEDGIDLENKGKGKQCFIKTDFALRKKESELDIILLEEPENHLSHTNMKRLIHKIDESESKQLFIATHNNLISTRLDLRRSILLNSNNTDYAMLNELPEDTAKFFMKASSTNLLEFILSQKVILVEGDAEFILMKAFFEEVTSDKIEDSEIHIISVGGTSFKRYLDIAELLDINTAVIRDNDGNYKETCIDRYSEYKSDNNKVFAESDNSISTFEIAVYEENTGLCEDLFREDRKTLSVQDFMLSNKTECAFEILDKKRDALSTPSYIQTAIKWINQ